MEQHQNERAGETGDPREKSLTNGIIWHDSRTCENPVTRPGIEPGSPWWEASVLIAQPSWPHESRNWALIVPCQIIIFCRRHAIDKLLPISISTFTGVARKFTFLWLQNDSFLQSKFIANIEICVCEYDDDVMSRLCVTKTTLSVVTMARTDTTLVTMCMYVCDAFWLECSPPAKANRVRFPAGSLPDPYAWKTFRTMPLVCGFFFSGISSFTRSCILVVLRTDLIGSQDPVVKCRPKRNTYCKVAERASSASSVHATEGCIVLKRTGEAFLSLHLTCMKCTGAMPAGSDRCLFPDHYRPSHPRLERNRFTPHPPRSDARLRILNTSPPLRWDRNGTTEAATETRVIHCLGPPPDLRSAETCRGIDSTSGPNTCGKILTHAVRIAKGRYPGWIPGGVALGFSHVGCVADNDTGQFVFSGISRSSRPCITVLLHTNLTSPSSALKPSMLRAPQISPPTHSNTPPGNCNCVLYTLKNVSGKCFVLFPNSSQTVWLLLTRSFQAVPKLIPKHLKRVSQTLSCPDCNYDGSTPRPARRSDEPLGVRVSVARIASSLLDLESAEPMRVIEVNMEQRRNEGEGETGDPRGNPPTNGIVRHDFHLRKSGDPGKVGGRIQEAEHPPSPVRHTSSRLVSRCESVSRCPGSTLAESQQGSATPRRGPKGPTPMREASHIPLHAPLAAGYTTTRRIRPSVNHVTNSQAEVAINSIRPYELTTDVLRLVVNRSAARRTNLLDALASVTVARCKYWLCSHVARQISQSSLHPKIVSQCPRKYEIDQSNGVQLSPSIVTADNQCAVAFGIFDHMTVESKVQVNMEQRLNERAGETGDPRENPPTSGIIRSDSHMRKFGSDPAGGRTLSALVGGEQANRSATPAPCEFAKCSISYYYVKTSVLQNGGHRPARHRNTVRTVRARELTSSPVSPSNREHFAAHADQSDTKLTWGRGGRAVSLLVSCQGESGSITGRASPECSHVGIGPDDAAGRRVFFFFPLGISRFPRPCVPALLCAHLTSPSSALETTQPIRAPKGQPRRFKSSSLSVPRPDLSSAFTVPVCAEVKADGHSEAQVAGKLHFRVITVESELREIQSTSYIQEPTFIHPLLGFRACMLFARYSVSRSRYLEQTIYWLPLVPGVWKRRCLFIAAGTSPVEPEPQRGVNKYGDTKCGRSFDARLIAVCLPNAVEGSLLAGELGSHNSDKCDPIPRLQFKTEQPVKYNTLLTPAQRKLSHDQLFWISIGPHGDLHLLENGVQLSPSTVTAKKPCAVNIDIFGLKNVASSLQVIELANFSGLYTLVVCCHSGMRQMDAVLQEVSNTVDGSYGIMVECERIFEECSAQISVNVQEPEREREKEETREGERKNGLLVFQNTRPQIHFRGRMIVTGTHCRCLPTKHGHSVLELPNSDWPTQLLRLLKPIYQMLLAQEHEARRKLLRSKLCFLEALAGGCSNRLQDTTTTKMNSFVADRMVDGPSCPASREGRNRQWLTEEPFDWSNSGNQMKAGLKHRMLRKPVQGKMAALANNMSERHSQQGITFGECGSQSNTMPTSRAFVSQSEKVIHTDSLPCTFLFCSGIMMPRPIEKYTLRGDCSVARLHSVDSGCLHGSGRGQDKHAAAAIRLANPCEGCPCHELGQYHVGLRPRADVCVEPRWDEKVCASAAGRKLFSVPRKYTTEIS
ncbi:hypothetical protein PR048_013735 [Dryococelus australis]|uniref:CST complex subunit CTC1 n=1 Tax=Dryococelus australis TaxID=614101 RepID=A0ABQ9HT09_9NEOP|nr:hypothetical protein PR048_013735 [Dryococelus australis]